MKHTNPTAQRILGFSLIEILLVISIMVAGTLFAVPQINSILLAKKVETTASGIFKDLSLARITAIQTGVPVVLCPGEPEAGCRTEPRWSEGWFGFLDHNRDQALSENERIIFKTLTPHNLKISWRTPHWVRFDSLGSAWPNGHFRVCDESATHKSAVILYFTGRARRASHAPSGLEIDCG